MCSHEIFSEVLEDREEGVRFVGEMNNNIKRYRHSCENQENLQIVNLVNGASHQRALKINTSLKNKLDNSC